MRTVSARWSFGLVVLIALLFSATSRTSRADAPPAPPAFPEASWAGQLDTLSRWLDAHKHDAKCTERCFVLDRLAITGSLADGLLRFELTGGVLAGESVAVPLFGPPSRVRLDSVVDVTGGASKPAALGFEADHYFVWTSARRFDIKGSFALPADLALNVPGPINAFDADIKGGRLVEGSKLSGLTGATLHFDRTKTAGTQSEPPVFQVSRAIRVARENTFEVHLSIRAGSDLGVVRFPLRFGESVLDVNGSLGWKVEGEDLTLPTTGHSAEITITGRMPKVASFTDDARSAYEFWLFESDAEHRLTFDGDARPLDPSESPIPRTQPSARLYMMMRGQHIDVSMQTLAGAEVLAAVVRSHERTVVLTRKGDLVSDDNLSYENNGIDYLPYATTGRTIFLATDGKSQRILRSSGENGDVMVALQTGPHTVHLQTLGDAKTQPFGGVFSLPMPTYPLTSSSVGVTLGLPENVHALAFLGGDHPEIFFGISDVVAVVLAFALAWIGLRNTATKLLGGVFLAGLWLVAPGLFVTLYVVLAAWGVVWTVRRLTLGRWKNLATAGVLLGACLVGLVALASLATLRMDKSPAYAPAPMSPPAGAATRAAAESLNDESLSRNAPAAPGAGDVKDDKSGALAWGQGGAGVLAGVTPVALTLPSSDHSIYLRRELVTKERPFTPVLFYVTDWALLPLLLVWLACAGLLVRAYLAELRLAWRKIRDRLAKPPAHLPSEGGVPSV